MKDFLKIFYLLLLLLTNDSFTQTIFSDSLFNYKTSYKGWEIFWNDSLAVRKDISTSHIDTIYCNISEYDDSDTNSFPYYYKKWNQMLSIVGPYLSYAVGYNGSGGVHPIYGSYYVTYNIETKKEISLDEIFNSKDIYEALLKDSTINKYLTNKNPSSLEDLVNNLDGKCEVNFSNILNCFSFIDINDEKVLVEFGLTHGCEVLRGNFTVIQILLPIPLEKSFMFHKALKDKTLESYL